MLATRFLVGANHAGVGFPDAHWLGLHADPSVTLALADLLHDTQRRALEQQAATKVGGNAAVSQALRQVRDARTWEDGQVSSASEALRHLEETLLADTSAVRWVLAQADPTRFEELGVPTMLAPAPQRPAVRAVAQALVEGRVDDCVGTVNAVRSLALTDTVVCLATGLVYLWRGDAEAMVEAFQTATDNAPLHPQLVGTRVFAREMLARAHFAVGDYAAAADEQGAAIEIRRAARLPVGTARYRHATYAARAGRETFARSELVGLCASEPGFLRVALADADLGGARGALRRALSEQVIRVRKGAEERLLRMRTRYDLMYRQARTFTRREMDFYGDELRELELLHESGEIEQQARCLHRIPRMEERLEAIDDLEGVRLATEEVDRELEAARRALRHQPAVPARPVDDQRDLVQTTGYLLLAAVLVVWARVSTFLASGAEGRVHEPGDLLHMGTLIDGAAGAFQGAWMVFGTVGFVVSVVGVAWVVQQVGSVVEAGALEAGRLVEDRVALVAELEGRSRQLRQRLQTVSGRAGVRLF
jgi:hypothetical protein